MNKQLLFTSLIAIGLSPVALAQEAGPAPEDELAVLPAFKAVDSNQDGMIDTAETEPLAEMLEQQHQIEFRFETVDVNEDSVIDAREYIAYDAVLKERLGIA
jgi:Ca2+-binding EF-hand superfamily protein